MKHSRISKLFILLSVLLLTANPAIATNNSQHSLVHEFRLKVKSMLTRELDLYNIECQFDFERIQQKDNVFYAEVRISYEVDRQENPDTLRVYALHNNEQIKVIFREPSEDFFKYASEIPLDLLPQERLQQWRILKQQEQAEMPATSTEFNYKLPFEGGTSRTISRGGTADGMAHNNSYDFEMSQGSVIRAARGGRVSNVLESSSDYCIWPNCSGDCDANYVVIEHLDGTFGWYLHISRNGVLVEKDDFVFQGDCIALSDATGCTGSNGNRFYHLHFNVCSTGDNAHENRLRITWVEGKDWWVDGENNPSLDGKGFLSPKSQNTSGVCGQSYEYKYEFHNQDIPDDPVVYKSGTQERVWFQVRNTGQAIWTPDKVQLGTYDPEGTSPLWQYGSYGWLSGNRIRLVEDSVAPNEIGTFEIDITIPSPQDNLDSEDEQIVWKFALTTADGSPVRSSNNTEVLSFQINVECISTSGPSDFCDVPRDHDFYPHIQFVSKRGISTVGCGGSYYPGRPIVRGNAARMLYRWIEHYWPDDVKLPFEGSFMDIQNVPSDMKEAIEYLKATGVISGYSDGTFKPDERVTRGQAAKMVVNLILKANPDNSIPDNLEALRTDIREQLDLEPGDDLYDNLYSDMPVGHAFEKYILQGTWIGLFSGFSDGTFRPGDHVTRGAMAKLLANAAYYVSKETRIVKGETLDYDILLTENESKEICPASPGMNLMSFSSASSKPTCFCAAAGAGIHGLTITQDNTLVCYWPQDEMYRLVDDMSSDYEWALKEIEAMFDAGIVTNDGTIIGCSNYGYCPEETLRRDHMVVFILRALHYFKTGQPGLSYTPTTTISDPVFPDVPLDHPWADWIYDAYEQGIIKGFSNGTFRPDDPADRAQIVMIILHALYGRDVLDNLPYPLGIFEDTPIANLNSTELKTVAAYEEMYWRGFTRGCRSDGLYYCPHEPDGLVKRSHAAVFITRAFLEPVPPTPRLGDFCFSTSSGYSIPKNEAPGLTDVGDEDIVCYHRDVNQFKMYFNGSVHGLDNIDIDALTIPQDGEVWFSTSGTETIPDVGDVRDEDVVRYQNGSFSLVLDGSDHTGLGSEDIDALHRYSSSKFYLSTSGSANYGFATKDEDIVRLDPGSSSFSEFFDGSAVGLGIEDVDGISIVSDDPSDSIIYLTTRTSFCLDAEDGSQLCGDDGDVILFRGETGSATAGSFEAALCFEVADHEGLEREDLDAIHIADDFVCDPPVSLLNPPYNPPPSPPLPPDYSLQVIPYHLHFNATEGESGVQYGEITISELGGSPIAWTASEGSDWIQLSGGASGTTPAIVDFVVNSATLFAGTYTGTITITATDALNSPQMVNVTLDVAAAYGTEPITLTAESGYNNIQLAWNPTNDPYVTQYRLSRAVTGTTVMTPIATISDTVYFDADPGLITNTTYCYQVEALRANGDVSSTSNKACASIKRLDLWVQGSTAVPGETGSVIVGIRNAQGLSIAASDIWLDYDANIIQYETISSTALTVDYMWNAGITAGDNGLTRLRISALAFPPSVLYNDGALFELTFRALGTDGDTSPLDLREFIEGIGGSTVYASDDPYNFVPLDLKDNTFLIEGTSVYGSGDLNGNSVVEAIDAYIAQQIAHREIVPTLEQLQAGDVNADGEISTEDVTMILYYAAHGEWPPLPDPGVMLHRASSSPTIISLDDVSGLPGEKVDTALRITDSIEMAGGTFVIAYDTALVAGIDDVEVISIADDFDLEFYDNEAGLLHITIANDNAPISGTGEIATLSLLLADGARGGESAPLRLIDVRLNDIHGRDLAYSVIQQSMLWNDAVVEIGNAPILRVSSTDLRFSMTKGGYNPENRSFVISNDGTGSLSWTASENIAWLELSQYTGTAPSIMDSWVDVTGLPVGTHGGTITITSLYDGTASKTVDVTLEIAPYTIYLPLVLRQF